MIFTPQLTPLAGRDQHVFRVVLDCMARPGSIRTIPLADDAPSGWGAVSAAGRCLIDHEVSFAVLSEAPSMSEHLLRVTGSRVSDAQDADFILLSGTDPAQSVLDAKVGTDEFPDDSATLLMRCDTLGSGSTVLELCGPGVRGTRELRLDGVTGEILSTLQEQNANYPLGVDTVFVTENGQIASLPRTTRFTVQHSGQEQG